MPAPHARRRLARLGLALTLAGMALPAPGCAWSRAERAPRSWSLPRLGRHAKHDHGADVALAEVSAPPLAIAAADAARPVVLPTDDAIARRLAARNPEQALARQEAATLPPPAAGGLAAPAPASTAIAAPMPAPAPTALATGPAATPTRVRTTAVPLASPAPAPAAAATALTPPSELPPLDLPGLDAPPPAPAAPPASAAAAPAPSAVAQVRELVAAASRQLETLRSYQVMMTRQERVGTSLLPEETVLLSIRRDPRAVRLEWPDGPNKGREVLYAADANGRGMMHVKMPNPLMPRITLPPDSPLALKNSRHPISEAGLDSIVAGLKATVDAHATGTAAPGDRLAYEGLVAPAPDLPPGHRITRVTPSGETWVVTLDAATHLPVAISGTAAGGEVLEHYVFRNLQSDLPELAAAGAFDPDGRWGAPRGLLGRIARGNPDDAATPPR